MKEIFIVLWLVSSYTGDVIIANPGNYHAIITDKEHLAYIVKYCKDKGYYVDVRVFKAQEFTYNLKLKEIPTTKIEADSIDLGASVQE